MLFRSERQHVGHRCKPFSDGGALQVLDEPAIIDVASRKLYESAARKFCTFVGAGCGSCTIGHRKKEHRPLQTIGQARKGVRILAGHSSRAM